MAKGEPQAGQLATGELLMVRFLAIAESDRLGFRRRIVNSVQEFNFLRTERYRLHWSPGGPLRHQVRLLTFRAVRGPSFPPRVDPEFATARDAQEFHFESEDAARKEAHRPGWIPMQLNRGRKWHDMAAI